uniref:BOS complex subunit NCLN n=1 Tax=Phallusia mammillata TaxID=59560 RepID=A0A6F9DMN4_9ASCI|nr:nicalin-1-like [Phallusia mammillata]
MIEEAIEAFRTSFPLGFVAVFPVILLVVSPITMVDAAHEFSVYRMQQYDLQGNSHGCRSALVNAEARTLQSTSMARKCVLLKANELTHARYLEVLDRGPSAIVVLISGNMSKEEVQRFMDLEVEMLRIESNLPIYFTYEDEELKRIYDQVTHSTSSDSGSAFQTIMSSATSVGYLFVTNKGQSKAQPDQALVNIEGILPGLGMEEQLPTIAIVAHYDAFGIAPYLSHGANSDASGVVTLLELARVLGKIYGNSRTHPRHNILFLLSGGGKFNYQGSKKWIEDASDNAGSSEAVSSALLNNAKLVLCLDSLGGNGVHALKMHVSKPPSETTVAGQIHRNIQSVAKSVDSSLDTSVVHKKIRLSSDLLAWEHERYSIRRLHAVTLSALSNSDDPMRRSIMDTKKTVDVDALTNNVQIIAESVLRYLYNVTEETDVNLASGDYAIHKDHIEAWLSYLAEQPRPAQALSDDHHIVTALEAALQKHVKNTRRIKFKADKRDPDFVFYDGLVQTMSASIVRSAVFDLYVTGFVAAYMAIVYLIVLKFNGVVLVASKLSSLPKVKVH